MKWLFLSVASVCYLAGIAQGRVGLHAELLSAHIEKIYTDPSRTATIEGSFIGWKIGARSEIPIASHFYFSPQLNIVRKGGEGREVREPENRTAVVSEDWKFAMSFLEAPLNLVYRRNHVYFGVGPVISMGISGRYFYEYRNGTLVAAGGNDNGRIFFTGKKDRTDPSFHFRRMELGANALAGYETSGGFFLNCSFNYGATNLFPGSDMPGVTGSLRLRYFSAGLGFYLKRKK